MADITKILTEISRHTGLNRETIKDLMKRGWMYEESGDFAVFRKPLKK